MIDKNQQGKQYGKTPQNISKRQNIYNNERSKKKLFKKRDISFEKYKIKVGPDQNSISNDQSINNNDQSPLEDAISPYSEFNAANDASEKLYAGAQECEQEDSQKS